MSNFDEAAHQAALNAHAAMETASDAYEAAMKAGPPRTIESLRESQVLLDAYLAATRAADAASAAADYGKIGDQLVDLGYRIKAARREYDTAMQLAAQLAVTANASSANIPQTVIARFLGVDRMTVRKWLGL